MFELTKRDVDFVWNLDYQQAFQALKGALVDVPMLIQPNSKKKIVLMWTSHQKVLEPYYHRRKANSKRWWPMLARVY